MNACTLQSFQRILDNQSPIAAMDVYTKLTKPSEAIFAEIKHVIRKEIFSYLPPFKASLISLGLSKSIFRELALSVKKSHEYDFIIIDTDTVFDEDKAALMNIADKVMIITDQTSSSVYATNILASNINGISAEKFIFICNNFNKDEENALISLNTSIKFTINEYIKNFEYYDQINCEDLSKDTGMQKAAILVL